MVEFYLFNSHIDAMINEFVFDGDLNASEDNPLKELFFHVAEYVLGPSCVLTNTVRCCHPLRREGRTDLSFTRSSVSIVEDT